MIFLGTGFLVISLTSDRISFKEYDTNHTEFPCFDHLYVLSAYFCFIDYYRDYFSELATPVPTMKAVATVTILRAYQETT